MRRRSADPQRPGRAAAASRLLVAVLGGALAACGVSGAASSPDEAPAATGPGDLAVVATTTMLGDVASQVVGDAGEVAVVMPPGADPHTFQPSARQVAQMQDADLLVVNGAGLEESLQDAVEEAEAAGVPVLRAADHVEPLAAGDDEHAEGGADPHFWMDPDRMAEAVTALGERLTDLSGEDAPAQRADDYARQLVELGEEIDAILASVPPEARTLVTDHDSLAYFAERFDFNVAGTVIPSTTTGAEPSAQDLEALAEILRREEVPAIFADTSQPDRLAQTLAEEVGAAVEVVPLHTGSLGTEDGGPTTYVEALRTDAERIAEALGS